MPTIPQEIAASTQRLQDNTDIVQQFAQGTANLFIPVENGTLRPLLYWQGHFQDKVVELAQPYVDQIDASTVTATDAADAASASAAAASASETSAAASEVAASSSAAAAQTAQTNAETAKSGAVTARGGAESARDQAQQLFTQFGDQYLGAFAADPTVDNSGNALTDGDIYFNTTDNVLKFYTGAAWVAPEDVATTAAAQAQDSAAAASTSEINAASSASAAAGSAATASTKADEAAASASAASAAATSEINAAASESAAAESAAAAAASESAAAASEGLAQQYAQEAEDTEVAPGEYSAYHWAQKAQSAAQQDVFWGDVLDKPTNFAYQGADQDATFRDVDARWLKGSGVIPATPNDSNAWDSGMAVLYHATEGWVPENYVGVLHASYSVNRAFQMAVGSNGIYVRRLHSSLTDAPWQRMASESYVDQQLGDVGAILDDINGEVV